MSRLRKENCAPRSTLSRRPSERSTSTTDLRDAKVRGERGLAALFANNADANVGGLDHRDVVAAVADRARLLAGVALRWRQTTVRSQRQTTATTHANERDDGGLLRRRAATADDRARATSEHDKVRFKVLETELWRRRRWVQDAHAARS